MAAGATYTPIATNTLGSNQSSVTFSSISGSYTDLVLVFNGTITTSAASWGLQFNSDTASNYSNTALYGDGSSAASNRATSATSTISSFSGTDNSTNIVQIMNYSNSTTYKTALSRNNGGGFVSARVALWRSTAAITSITAVTSSNQFATGSTFTLYGISAA
jgi:hypothetical protein